MLQLFKKKHSIFTAIHEASLTSAASVLGAASGPVGALPEHVASGATVGVCGAAGGGVEVAALCSRLAY